jgi:hypothetical protein
LFVRSQELDNASFWVGNNLTSITGNTGDTTAPDGTSTAELITNNTGASNHFIQGGGNLALVVGLVYTFSIFAKAGTGTTIQIVGGNPQFGTTRFANFDLSAGTVGTVGGDATATITSVGNSWYRCTMTATCQSATAAAQMVVALTNSSSATRLVSYTGTSETIYLWGAQLEQRSSVTAYTATTTAPITNYIPALQTAASGVARFEHNPVTGESLGLEIEEQRTNLMLRSEEFDNASWGKTNTSITANAIIAPDGTLTGDRVVENTTASIAHQVTQSPTGGTAGLVYTLSMYMKAAGRNFGYLQLADGSSPNKRFGAVFDLASGVVGSTFTANSPTSTSSTITAVGNGWYRCTISMTQTAGTTINTGFATSDSSSPTVNASIYPIYTGDGWSGVFIWGAQLEAGAFATSYIPTVASQVTRSADAASMTGTNFSSWYRADAGTIYSDCLPLFATGSSRVLSISDNTFANRFLVIASTANHFYVNAGGVVVADLPVGAYSTTVTNKQASTYAVNDFAVSLNAGAVVADTSGALPAGVNRLYIGADSDGASNFLNGTIKKLAYYPKRLTNAELQGLTTV